jgi:hypothetical protein
MINLRRHKKVPTISEVLEMGQPAPIGEYDFEIIGSSHRMDVTNYNNILSYEYDSSFVVRNFTQSNSINRQYSVDNWYITELSYEHYNYGFGLIINDTELTPYYNVTISIKNVSTTFYNYDQIKQALIDLLTEGDR